MAPRRRQRRRTERTILGEELKKMCMVARAHAQQHKNGGIMWVLWALLLPCCSPRTAVFSRNMQPAVAQARYGAVGDIRECKHKSWCGLR